MSHPYWTVFIQDQAFKIVMKLKQPLSFAKKVHVQILRMYLLGFSAENTNQPESIA